MRVIFFSISFRSLSHFFMLYMLFFDWILFIIYKFSSTIFTNSRFLYGSFSDLFLFASVTLTNLVYEFLQPFSSMFFIFAKRTWFSFSISMLRTSSRAAFLGLWLRNMKCWGLSLPTEPLIRFNFYSWMRHDLLRSLSKQILLLVGIALNIVNLMNLYRVK